METKKTDYASVTSWMRAVIEGDQLKVLEMVEEGILDKDTVIMACVKYMSEDDVADMMHHNEFIIDEEEDY